MTKRNGVTKNDGDAVDNDSDESIAIDTLPENRSGAIFDTKPAVEDKNAMYCTISRWILRLKLWNKYLANAPQAKVPDVREFLFSLDPAIEKNAVEPLIWGADKGSLISLKGDRERLQLGLEALQRDLEAHRRDLEPLQRDLKALQSDLDALQRDLEARQRDLQDVQSELEQLRVSRDEILASVAGQSDFVRQLVHSQQELLLKSKEDNIQGSKNRIKEREDLVKSQEDLVKIQEDLIKSQEDLVKSQSDHIKERENHIKERENRIKEMLENTLGLHREIGNLLDFLAAKGNQTGGTGSCTAMPDTSRVRTSAPQPLPSRLEEIKMTRPDESFLKDLLANDKIECHKKDLLELQAFVAALLKEADRAKIVKARKWKKNLESKVKNFVDAILDWKPGHDIESVKKFGLACPSKGCEEIADQPILFAFISRILEIIGQSFMSVRSEQVLGPVKTSGQGRRIDFIVDEQRENLHVLYPEMLGRAIEVKPASHDDATEFRKYQDKAREQVLGHLAKRLLASFDFAGIGQNDVVCGVVLSMISVQVIEMELTEIGTANVAIKVRQTALVPLLGKTLVPHEIHKNSEGWNLKSNGVLLLASAMLELPRQPQFGQNTKLSMKDLRANGEQLTIGALLGSGSFAHVVQLNDQMFMKIPRSERMVKSLEKECNMLQKIQGEPFIPEIMSWGISTVEVSIRSEISKMTVLRLKGIVGSSLGRYCKSKLPIKGMKENVVDDVIRQVCNALEYAHDKGIVHLDVRPSNIIVAENGEELDVLLADWGCSMMFEEEKIKEGTFIGCAPYAHDALLGEISRELKPDPSFDLASLGYTWYHVVRNGIPWRFDRPKLVSENQLTNRRNAMVGFLEQHCNDGRKATWAEKICKIFDIKSGKRLRR